MASDVNQAIAEYLQRIHTKVVFPVVIEKGSKNYRPDRLVMFQEMSTRAYLRAITLFRRPCKADGDCESGKCVNGKCGDLVVGPVNLSAGFECMRNQDCLQTERCIDGECVPTPFIVEFAAVNVRPSYGPELIRAFEKYSGRIYEVLAHGLAEQPAAIIGVRAVLTQMYADAVIAAGTLDEKCERNCDCDETKVCVDGICVPIPFRLVFRGIDVARADPWTKS